MRIGMGLLLACALAGCAQQGELRRPDGTMRASGQLRGGLQEGVWTHRHPDGSKQAEGPCKGDAQHGEWTWWRADGSVEQRGSFELGMKTGVWSTWRVDGSRSSSGTCHEGLEHGPWSFWRVDGSLERSGWYHLGSPAGPWTIHDASGAVKAFGHYQGGVMVGDWLARAGDGSWTRTTYPAADGVVLVVERARQATTNAEEVDARWLRRTGALASGTKEGLWVGWHGGGSARLAASFVDDRAHGLVQACDSDGRVMAQGAAREGALAGTWRYAQGDGWRLESYDPSPARASQSPTMTPPW
jgi:antitoxin component YwqK of YwqJK toxin-antitoxin module